ncbi:MAG TPA: thermonuclease family protein [Bacilli bacterium]|nr:thermonuclease family protein [Bacilli bacterium]
MKKIRLIILGLLVLFINVNSVYAKEKVNATLNKCVDGDTAWFNVKKEVIKARFLAINTPESTTKKEEYGKEASEYTCNALKNAKKIVLEYDENSEKKDKYNRDLVWVWVDGKLLQEELLKEGLAETKYLYGDYDYTPHLQEVEKEAKANKLNMWSNNSEEELTTIDYIYIGAGLGIVVILLLSNKKTKAKKLFNEIIKRK